MPGGVILLEEASTSCCGGSLPGSMIDASGSSPGGLIFAVYFSPGGAGFFSAGDHGLVSTSCAVHGSALETSGLCTFSGNIGLEICWLEQAWAALVESGTPPSHFELYFIGLKFVFFFVDSQSIGLRPFARSRWPHLL